jgi:uncharacterized integral membrane protein (TIGR00697 family)
MLNSEKIFTILCSIFSLVTVLGNLTYRKFIYLDIPYVNSFELSVGVLLYPIAFFIISIISEFYGKEKARFCVNIGVLMNIFGAIIVTTMNWLPATSWSEVDDNMFHNIFGYYEISFGASILACYISQFLDIQIYAFVKKLTNGKYILLRNYTSTFISLFVDTFIVIYILESFALIPTNQMWPLIINGYSFKIFFTICSTPLFYIIIFLIQRLLLQENKEIYENQSA